MAPKATAAVLMDIPDEAPEAEGEALAVAFLAFLASTAAVVEGLEAPAVPETVPEAAPEAETAGAVPLPAPPEGEATTAKINHLSYMHTVELIIFFCPLLLTSRLGSTLSFKFERRRVSPVTSGGLTNTDPVGTGSKVI